MAAKALAWLTAVFSDVIVGNDNFGRWIPLGRIGVGRAGAVV
jgi:hypothetical protein